MDPIGYSKRNFLISVGFCALAVGILSAMMVQGARSNVPPSLHYRGPADCSKCHDSEYYDWNTSAHAQAFGVVFQSQWKAQGSPESCLTCHTTGFNPQTGSYSMGGVTCETCHGPGGSMAVNSTSALCGTCHSVSHSPTYTDWLSSNHSHAGVGCVDCHDPMSGRLVEEPLKLCGRCHSNKVAELSVGAHGTVGNTCTDCHMVRSVRSLDGTVHNQTGHTFLPSAPSLDCKSCHTDLGTSHNMWGNGTKDCLTCHDPVVMSQLHLLDGTSVPGSDGSALCRQCHAEKYSELVAGTHGDPLRGKNCTDCHRAMHWDVALNATLPPIRATLSASAPTQVVADIKLGDIDLGKIEFGTLFTVAFAVLGAVGLIVVLRRI